MKRIVLFIFCLWAHYSFSQDTLSYQVSVKGHRAGEATLAITAEANAYQVVLTLYPNAMAKLLGIDDMREMAVGHINEGHYYPKRYDRKTLDDEQLLSVDFDGKQAYIEKYGHSSKLPISLDSQDPLTQIAQIQYDLLHGQLAKSYALLTDKTLRKYQTDLSEKKQWRVVTLTQIPKGERVLKLWFDKQGLLQRMQKNKRGKKDFDMIRQTEK